MSTSPVSLLLAGLVAFGCELKSASAHAKYPCIAIVYGAAIHFDGTTALGNRAIPPAGVIATHSINED